MDNSWDKKPEFPHLAGALRDRMEERRRHRQVRYILFSIQTALEAHRPLTSVKMPPGFAEFWLLEKPAYQVDPLGKRRLVDPAKMKMVKDMGGYAQFAKRWDVDKDLIVYLRHSSVWQEWNAVMARVVPILGED